MSLLSFMMTYRNPKDRARQLHADQGVTHFALSYFLLSTFSLLRMYPFTTAVSPMLFLPNGYSFLKSFDDVTARLESFGPMGAAHGNGHADVTKLQAAQAVNHCQFADGPAAPGICLNLGERFLRQGRMRLI